MNLGQFIKLPCLTDSPHPQGQSDIFGGFLVLLNFHGLLILFLRLGWETRIPPVPKDCFGIVQVGNDIFKKFYRANFDFL